MPTALKLALSVAAGWLSHEFSRRGKALYALRREVSRQRLVIQQGAILNTALREELVSRQSSQPEQVLEVPVGEPLPDSVTIGLAQFERYTEPEWEAWHEAAYRTIRELTARRVEHRTGQEVARLEAMARGVGPDAAPVPCRACRREASDDDPLAQGHARGCPVRAGGDG
jgi:hypothetical protein